MYFNTTANDSYTYRVSDNQMLHVVRANLEAGDDEVIELEVNIHYGAILFPASDDPLAFRVTRQMYFGPGVINDSQLGNKAYTKGHWIPVESGRKDHSYTTFAPINLRGRFVANSDTYTLAVGLKIVTDINAKGRKITVIPPHVSGRYE